MKSKFKILAVCSFFLACHQFLDAQHFHVEGTAKVDVLTLDNNANQVLVLLNDGIIGVRDISTIGGGGSSEFIVGGAAANNGFDDGTDNFMPMASGSLRSNVIANVDTRVPMDGTISSLEGGINGATIGTNYNFTVYKNGVATSLTCVVNTGSVVCTDLTHSVQFCAGDRIAVNFVGNDNGTNSDNRVGRWVALFTPNSCP